MKITRRKTRRSPHCARSRGGNASGAMAQTPAASADPLEAARARIKANGDALAKETVPMSTEPAFQFKA